MKLSAPLDLTGARTFKPYTQSKNKKAPDLTIKAPSKKCGVDDGNRTHDNWNHNPALYQLSYAHHIALQLLACQSCLMAHPAGLEPATIRLEGGCSIQLSYGRLSLKPNRTRP